MEFRVLGPLEAWAGRQQVRLNASRDRRVLAALLLDANRVVPVERLIDAVWDGKPPTTAREQVRVCVSALRRVLRASGARQDMVATHPPGYMIRIEDRQLDALAFMRSVGRARDLVGAGRGRDASVEYRRALALWRGRALEGMDGRVFEASMAYLNEQRLLAVEECFELELELGRDAELIGELSALVAEYPFRERLHGLLMLSLYRVGRQAEALAAFRTTREFLRDELGLEPSEELRRLEHRILNQDPDLDLDEARTAEGATAHPASVPRQLPADVMDFTGRDREVAQIRELLANGGPETGSVVVSVAGKAGVGKTALAVHAAHRLIDRFPDGQLYVNLRGTGQRPADPAAVLAGFLRALGLDRRWVPESPEERAGMYRSLLADRRVLVVLDDAAESQVGPLLPGGAGCGVLVTSRTPLTGLAGARLVDVDVLDLDRSVQLLARVAGAARVRAEPRPARRLGQLCGGLPLALRVLGARLAARPPWRLADLVARLQDEHRRLDELAYGGLEVRASLALTYQALAPDTRVLFRRLGLLTTPDLAAWMAAPLLGASATYADDLFEQLVDARLVDPLGKDAVGQDRYRFHDLTRLYARERAHGEEPAGERTAALARVFGCLLALEECAQHREYGGDYAQIHSGAARWRPTHETVERVRSNSLRWLDCERRTIAAAVQQAGGIGLDELCWDIATTAVVLFQAQYFDEWQDTAEQALTATHRAGNRRGEAAALHSLGELRLEQQRYREAEELLGQAIDLFDQIGERHGYALSLRYLATVNRMHGRWDAALCQYDAARAILHDVEDPLAEAYTWGGVAMIALDAARPADAERLLRQALAQCRQLGRRVVEAQMTQRLGECLTRQGHLKSAECAFEEVLDISRYRGDRLGQAYALLGLGEVFVRHGRCRSAETTLAEALHHCQRAGAQFVEARIFLASGHLDLTRLRGATAVRQIRRASRIFCELDVPLWQARALTTLSAVYEAGGAPAAARRAERQARELFTRIGAAAAPDLAMRLKAFGTG